jgi:hypothetical protein
MRVYFPPAEQHGEKLSDEQAYRPLNNRRVKAVVAIIDGMSTRFRKRVAEHRR